MKNNLILVSILVYVVFAIIYYRLRRIDKKYGETGDIVFIILLVIFLYLFWSNYYRIF